MQLLVGLAVSRGIRSESDYVLAGRRLGYPLAIFSIFATWFGAETCKVRIARVGVVLAGVLAHGLAFSSEGVYQLVEDPSAFGGAGVFVVMVFAAFSGFGGTRSAHVAPWVGMALQLAGTHLGLVPYPFTVSLFASLAAHLAVGAWEANRWKEE